MSLVFISKQCGARVASVARGSILESTDSISDSWISCERWKKIKKYNLECHELTDYHNYTKCGVLQGLPAVKKLELHSVKLRYFLSVFNIANQLLTSHSPFMPHCQVDEWTYNKLFMWNFSSRVQCEWYRTCEKLSRTLEKKFHIYVGPCIILYSFIVFSMINLLNSSQWMY